MNFFHGSNIVVPEVLEERIHRGAHELAMAEVFVVIKDMPAHDVCLRMFENFEVRRIPYLNRRTSFRVVNWRGRRQMHLEGTYDWRMYQAVGRARADKIRMSRGLGGWVTPNVLIHPVEEMVGEGYGLGRMTRVWVVDTPRVCRSDTVQWPVLDDVTLAGRGRFWDLDTQGCYHIFAEGTWVL